MSTGRRIAWFGAGVVLALGVALWVRSAGRGPEPSPEAASAREDGSDGARAAGRAPRLSAGRASGPANQGVPSAGRAVPEATRLILVKGVVLNDEGRRLKDASSVTVDVLQAEPGARLASLPCDGRGDFSGWVAVPVATPSISCVAHDDQAARVSQAFTTTMTPELESAAVLLILGEGVAVTARATGEGGSPVGGAGFLVVEARDQRRDSFSLSSPGLRLTQRLARADAAGRIRLTAARGQVQVRTVAPDGTLGAPHEKAAHAGYELDFGDLPVPGPGRTVRARVVDPQGAGVAGATVQLGDTALGSWGRHDAGLLWPALTTNAEGRFELSNVAADAFPVRMAVCSPRHAVLEVELPASDTEATIVLAPRPSFTVLVRPAGPSLVDLLRDAAWGVDVERAPRHSLATTVSAPAALLRARQSNVVLPDDPAVGRFTGFVDTEGTCSVNLALAGGLLSVTGTVESSLGARQVLELRVPQARRVILRCTVDPAIDTWSPRSEQVFVVWKPWQDPEDMPEWHVIFLRKGFTFCVPPAAGSVEMRPQRGVGRFLPGRAEVGEKDDHVDVFLRAAPDLELVSFQLTGGGEPLEFGDAGLFVFGTEGGSLSLVTDARGVGKLHLPKGTFSATSALRPRQGEWPGVNFTVPRGTADPVLVPLWR